MRIPFLAILVSVLAFAATPAFAADPPPPPPAASPPAPPEAPRVGLELDARTGVALPLGYTVSGAQMSDSIAAQIPVQIDFGVRPEPHWFVGAYGSYGALVPASNACPGGSCSGYDLRVGVEAAYRFRPDERLNPWIGLGTGYEWLTFSQSADGANASVTLRGFEIVNLQTGLDIAVHPRIHVGPYIGASLGLFDHVDESVVQRGETFQLSEGVLQMAVHGWATLGVRGSFDLL